MSLTLDAGKRRKRKARRKFLAYYKKLTKSLETSEKVEKWYDHVSELRDLIDEFENELPPHFREKLLETMDLVDTTKDGISKARSLLRGDLKSLIETELTDALAKTANSTSSSSPLLRQEVFGFAISKSIAVGGLTAAIAVTAIVIAVSGLDDEGIYSPEFSEEHAPEEPTILPESPSNAGGGGFVGAINGITDQMGP